MMTCRSLLSVVHARGSITLADAKKSFVRRVNNYFVFYLRSLQIEILQMFLGQLSTNTQTLLLGTTDTVARARVNQSGTGIVTEHAARSHKLTVSKRIFGEICWFRKQYRQCRNPHRGVALQ